MWTSRKTTHYEGQDHPDDPINLFHKILNRPNEHVLIQYTNQTSPGQSGGAVLFHNGNECNLIAIHVSGDDVSLQFIFMRFFKFY